MHSLPAQHAAWLFPKPSALASHQSGRAHSSAAGCVSARVAACLQPFHALQGAVINVLGAGATMLGLSATIGVLLAKTLTSATVNPFLATSSTNWNPVLAFDVFNVQVRSEWLGWGALRH